MLIKKLLNSSLTDKKEEHIIGINVERSKVMKGIEKDNKPDVNAIGMRLTPKQKEFLSSIFDESSGQEPFWECFKHERRTAISLYKKGWIEFEDKSPPDSGEEYFMARMTEEGWGKYTSNIR